MLYQWGSLNQHHHRKPNESHVKHRPINCAFFSRFRISACFILKKFQFEKNPFCSMHENCMDWVQFMDEFLIKIGKNFISASLRYKNLGQNIFQHQFPLQLFFWQQFQGLSYRTASWKWRTLKSNWLLL